MAVAFPRPARSIAVATIVLLVCLLFLVSWRTRGGEKTVGVAPVGMRNDPLLKDIHEPEEPLQRVDGDSYSASNPSTARRNATLLSLVRNSELEDILVSVRELESSFNGKFNYPWLFLNDRHFSQSFMAAVRKETKAEVRFETVPWEHWRMPEWINEDLYQESVEGLAERDVSFASQLQYHQMCRWSSGLFYQHPALQDIRYYMRVEPGMRFFCDIDYDVFAWMEDHKKTYAFATTLSDNPQAVAGLWPETKKFVAEHPELLHENNAIGWLESQESGMGDLAANGYSTCHFWSNFEIGDMNFWRSDAYQAFFDHLDRVGGFFYERWSDAHVHSIALGLFEDKRNIHWFSDIGFQQGSIISCPDSPKCGGCSPGKFSDGQAGLVRETCRENWVKVASKD